MYSTAPISATAAPGVALYAALEVALLSVGFVLVDTVNISTRTHKVLKSPAASNVYNLDWYIDFSFASTDNTSTFCMRTFEDYNATTHLAFRGPGLSSGVAGGIMHAPTWSWAGTTGYALETNWTMSGANTNLSTSLFTYWASITPDRVIFMQSASTTSLYFAGFYEPDPFFHAQAGAASFPLFCGSMGGSNTFFGYLTRLPLVMDGSFPEADSNLDVNGSVYLNSRWLSQYPITTPDPARWNYYAAYPLILIKMSNSPWTGLKIGRLRDVLFTRGNSSGTQVQGDTMSVTTNPALTGGNDYAMTIRNTNIYMFRTL